ncbi:GntR family transcriptional regulator [Marinobacterium aestuariivivens]|uniref:GntR family transcriptional regulator n=1 Tax=Marinobacterium aestuariivivens TaxID=1698799 RepID=A0ABW2A7N0_9GAMM
MNNKLNRGPQPVVRETMSSVVTQQIRDAILAGVYPPGSQLNEQVVADSCAVSRGPIREAIQRLLQEGLLVSKPHRGVFVVELTEEAIEDIYFARDAVEQAALRRIVRSDCRQALSVELMQIAKSMKLAAEREEWAEVASLDMRFHTELVNAAGSKRLSRLFDTLTAEAGLCLNQLLGIYRGREGLVEQHEEIAELIASGDEQQLLQTMNHHLQDPVETIVDAWENERPQKSVSRAATGRRRG